jgi:hypothetical protein
LSVGLKKHKILRKDEILALLFFITATVVSSIYGYSLRFYILTDILLYYLSAFPIYLVFLFYAYIKNPFLKFGWTGLALSLTAYLLLSVARIDIPSLREMTNLRYILTMGFLFWACSLFIYFQKRIKQKKPYLLGLKTKALSFNIARFIRDWAPIFVVLFSYLTLKSIIPVVNPALFDKQFYTMDYTLFLKNSPTELAVRWVPVSLMGFLSFGYKFYFILKMLAFSSIYCTIKDKRIFYRMVMAFSIASILGLALYFIFPAQGPIYYFPEKFKTIQTSMSETSIYKLQEELWTVYEQVKKNTPRDFFKLTKSSGIRNGIAAFPSLHIAISCVLLYFLFRYKRTIFWLCFFPFWVMVLSTIYFGWHYVVDDIAGFALAAFVLFFTNRLLRE